MPQSFINWFQALLNYRFSFNFRNPFVQPLFKPFSQKMLIRLLLMIIAALAITAGVFQELYRAEQKKYARLEDRYVRVRDQLGRDVVQEIIDRSRLEE